MAVSVLAEALLRWQHAAGPFWPYVCAAPFLATDEVAAPVAAGDGARSRPRADRASARPRPWSRREQAFADALLGVADGDAGAGPVAVGPSLVLLDLPPEPVLAVAPLLVARGWYVVPVIQRWIAQPALLPCRALLARLVVGARHARRPTRPRGAVLVADGARFGPIGRPPTVRGRVFDNRYEYQICRFPSTAFLQAHGVRAVRWLTAPTPGAPAVAPDLVPYLETVLQAGVRVDVRTWPLEATVASS